MLTRTLYAAGAIAAIGLMAGVAYDAGARATTHRAQPEEEAENGMMGMDPAALIQMMQAMSTPDEHHAFLKKFDGNYTCTLKFWMEPGAEPETSTGTTTSKWELGNRYLRSDFDGAFKFAGNEIPIKGIGYMGYDRATEQFFTLWMDSMSTSAMKATGTADMNAGTLTVEGTTNSVMGESRMKNVYTLTDDGYTMEFYEPNPENPGGDLMKTGVIEYTRK